MDRRDEFAKAAMTGLLAGESRGLTDPHPSEVVAKVSVAHADAVIAEIDRTKPKAEPQPDIWSGSPRPWRTKPGYSGIRDANDRIVAVFDSEAQAQAVIDALGFGQC